MIDLQDSPPIILFRITGNGLPLGCKDHFLRKRLCDTAHVPGTFPDGIEQETRPAILQDIRRAA